MYNKKGFTLLELLIVMGIIVILTGVLVTVLNPAELLKRARDTRRLQDVATLNRAMGFYSTDIATPNYTGDTTANDRCSSGTTKTIFLTSTTGTTTAVSGWAVQLASTGSTTVNGSGWIPTNFTALSAGSPIPSEPVDPSNSANGSGPGAGAHYYYTFACDKTSGATSNTWELNANLESATYKNGGGSDKETGDGGDVSALFEVGSYPGLSLLPTASSASFYQGF